MFIVDKKNKLPRMEDAGKHPGFSRAGSGRRKE